MGRMSFTQELKELVQASEGMDACGCWREVLHPHRELGRRLRGWRVWTSARAGAIFSSETGVGELRPDQR